MKSYEGYLKQKFGNEYLLLAGGQHLELSNFKTASSNWLPISRYNDVNFNTFMNNTADLHNLSSEELNLFRFYSENPQTYNLPCNDSLALIFSIDNSKDWIRALHFDIRTSDIYTINKTLGTWGNWSKIITSDNISLYIGSGTGFLPSVVTSNNATWNSGVAITDYGNAWAQRSMQIMCPNLTLGSASFICTGKADNTRNMGWMGFVYDGDGSTSNRLSFGLYAVDNIISLMGNGYTYFNGFTYYINGGYYNGTAAAANSVLWSNVTSNACDKVLYCASGWEVLHLTSSYTILGYGNPPRSISTYVDGYNIFFRCGSNYTAGLTINSSAQATFASNVYSNSDRRLKKHILSIDKHSLNDLFDVSDKLLKQFEWKQSGNISYGFIALELEHYIPEAVISDKNDIKSVSYDVAYAKIIASLIYKIKELEKEIVEIKNGKVSN